MWDKGTAEVQGSHLEGGPSFVVLSDGQACLELKVSPDQLQMRLPATA